MEKKTGVYTLANIGPNAFKGDVYVNGEFNTTTYPGELTIVKGVAVNDRITIMKKTGFLELGKEIFADFNINIESIDFDYDEEQYY